MTVNGRVRNAATCQQRLLSHQGFALVFASNSRRCSSTFSAHITIGANPTTVPRTVAFELIARNGKRVPPVASLSQWHPDPCVHVTRAARRSSGGTIGVRTPSPERTGASGQSGPP